MSKPSFARSAAERVVGVVVERFVKDVSRAAERRRRQKPRIARRHPVEPLERERHRRIRWRRDARVDAIVDDDIVWSVGTDNIVDQLMLLRALDNRLRRREQ
jgi:hypothetical protein